MLPLVGEQCPPPPPPPAEAMLEKTEFTPGVPFPSDGPEPTPAAPPPPTVIGYACTETGVPAGAAKGFPG